VTARTIGSVVYAAVTLLLPVAVIINLVNHHWFSFGVAVVATVLLVPLAVALIRQSGPAAKLIFPLAVTAVIAVLLIGAGVR
jgi:hypothetical protein